MTGFYFRFLGETPTTGRLLRLLLDYYTCGHVDLFAVTGVIGLIFTKNTFFQVDLKSSNTYWAPKKGSCSVIEKWLFFDIKSEISKKIEVCMKVFSKQQLRT